jgi:hypothetical protein
VTVGAYQFAFEKFNGYFTPTCSAQQQADIGGLLPLYMVEIEDFGIVREGLFAVLTDAS